MSDNYIDKVKHKINDIRLSIDNFDNIFIYLLAERFKCTRTIGQLKAICKLPPVDSKREAKQMMRLQSLAKSFSMNPVFIENLFNLIIKEVIDNHKSISKNYK